MEMHTYPIDYLICFLGVLLLFTITIVTTKEQFDDLEHHFDWKKFWRKYADDGVLAILAATVFIISLPEFTAYIVDDIIKAEKPFTWNTGFSLAVGLGGYFMAKELIGIYKFFKHHISEIAEGWINKFKRR
jgi:hypothetical protein